MTPQTPPTDRPLTAGDDLYERAKVFATRDKASTSYLQRRLQIGYNQAAALIERIQAKGLISAPNHAGMRTILVPYASRPATSAASEGGKLPDGAISGTDDGQTVWLESSTGGAHALGVWGGLSLRFEEADGTHTIRDYVDAALASPPVSERERELEGALDACSAALQRLHTDIEALMTDSEGVAGLHRNGEIAPWSDLQEGGAYADWLGEPLWAARNAWADARRALTAQPAGEK